MKFLVILGFLLVSQTVLAKSSLSSSIRASLHNSLFFRLDLLFSGSSTSKTLIAASESRLSKLKEINSSPTLVEEAQSLVLQEHDEETLTVFNSMLGLQQTADKLGIELKPDLDTTTIALIQSVYASNDFVTEDDFSKFRDEIREWLSHGEVKTYLKTGNNKSELPSEYITRNDLNKFRDEIVKEIKGLISKQSEETIRTINKETSRSIRNSESFAPNPPIPRARIGPGSVPLNPFTNELDTGNNRTSHGTLNRGRD